MELSKELKDFLATHDTKVAEMRAARGKTTTSSDAAATSFDELMAAFNGGKLDPTKIGFTVGAVAPTNSATTTTPESQDGGSSDSTVANSIESVGSQSSFNQAFETALAEHGLGFAVNAITGNGIGMLGKAVSIAAETYSAYSAMENFANDSLAAAVTTQAQENAQHEAAVAALNESISLGGFGHFGGGNPNANQSSSVSSSSGSGSGGGSNGGLTSSEGLSNAGLSATEGFGGFGVSVGEGFGGLSDGFGNNNSDGYSVGSGDSGDGGGDGGGKIVCTAMNQHYGFGSYRNKIWLRYAKKLTPAHEAGYHYLFLPLVSAAYKETHWYSTTLRKALEHIARRRTVDIKAELRNSKRSTYNRFLRAVLEPLCYIVGTIVIKLRNRK